MKIAFLWASMVVTYCIDLFRMGADRNHNFLLSFLLLVAEAKMKSISAFRNITKVADCWIKNAGDSRLKVCVTRCIYIFWKFSRV